MEKIKAHARMLATGPLIAALIGVLAWNGVVLGLCALPLFVFLWRCAPSRRWALITAAAYYLAAGRGLLLGAGVFFGDGSALPSWVYGFAIWIVPSVTLAAVWAALWGNNWRPVRLLAALLLVSVPPIGVIGWANPITAAGALFPGTGWWGLAACIVALAHLTHTRRPAIAFVAIALFAALANGIYHERTDSRWMAINTNLGASHGSDDDFERLHALLDAVEQRATNNPGVKVFVLPELVGGDWSMNALWWQRTSSKLRARGQTALVGALQPLDRNTHYVNALFTVGADANKTMVDRVPVPYSMWKPWEAGSADTFWSDAGVHQVGGTRIATVICYEQLLVWPVLHSFAHDPQILVGAANDWWARETNISRIQHEATRAWGRLFAVPVVWAKNE
ncbi:nitrilase-related carbon-nitrogen hydrolase [Paraburkholderia fungorum]|uniref:nitrilase-related carbon-nitrogen hydrolase n=1 Tax=Paraburkholderia fungorum TaxID=134537 RepID=UPI00402B2AFE